MGRRVQKYFAIVSLTLSSALFPLVAQARAAVRSDLFEIVDSDNNHRIDILEILDLSLALLGYTDFESRIEYDVNKDLVVNNEDKRILSLFLVSYKERYQIVIRAINSIDTNFDQVISEDEISTYKANFNNSNENTDDMRILSRYDLNYDRAFNHKDVKLIDYIIDESHG